MKKVLISLGILGMVLSCVSVDKKMVNYNTERLDTVEKYLYENGELKLVPKEKYNKLGKEGQEAIRQQISVEKEAESWVKK